MNKPVLDWIYRYVDPVLARFGVGKTEFVALVIVVLTAATNSGLLPTEARDWLVANWQEWLSLSVAAGMLSLRHAVAKVGSQPDVLPQPDPTPAAPLPTWVWVVGGVALGYFLPDLIANFKQ